MSSSSYVGDTSNSTYDSIDTVLLNNTYIDPHQPLRQSLFIEDIEENRENLSTQQQQLELQEQQQHTTSNSDTSSGHIKIRNIPSKLYAYHDDSKLSSASSQIDMQTSTPSREKSSDDHSSTEKRGGFQPVAVHTTRPIDFQNEAIEELCENGSESNTGSSRILDKFGMSDRRGNSDQSADTSQHLDTNTTPAIRDIINPAVSDSNDIDFLVRSGSRSGDHIDTRSNQGFYFQGITTIDDSNIPFEQTNFVVTSSEQRNNVRESVQSVDTGLLLTQIDGTGNQRGSNVRQSVQSVETSMLLPQAGTTDNTVTSNLKRDSMNTVETNLVTTECPVTGNPITKKAKRDSTASVETDLFMTECPVTGKLVPVQGSGVDKARRDSTASVDTNLVLTECPVTGKLVPVPASEAAKDKRDSTASVDTNLVLMECPVTGKLVPVPPSEADKARRDSTASVDTNLVLTECPVTGKLVPVPASEAAKDKRDSTASVDTNLVLTECPVTGKLVPVPASEAAKDKRDSTASVDTNLVLMECPVTGKLVPVPPSEAAKANIVDSMDFIRDERKADANRESGNSLDTNIMSGVSGNQVAANEDKSNRDSSQTVDTNIILSQKSGSRNVSDNSIINPVKSGSDDITSVATNAFRISDPISASRLEVISSSGEFSSDERDRQMEILEQQVSPRLYSVAGINAANELQRTASQELRLFAEEHRGMAPPNKIKFDSEFVPLSYNLSRKSSFVSANESPKSGTQTPQKSSSAKKGGLTQSPFLIGKLLVTSPDDASSERQDSNSSYEPSAKRHYDGLEDSNYPAIPILRNVSGPSKWRNGSTSTISLNMNTPTRPHLANYQLSSHDSLILPDIDPKDDKTEERKQQEEFKKLNRATYFSKDSRTSKSGKGLDKDDSKRASKITIPTPEQTDESAVKKSPIKALFEKRKSKIQNFDNEKELIPPEDAAQSSSRGSTTSRSYPNPDAQNVEDLYNDDMFSDMEDGLDIEYLGNMIRARRDDSYSIHSVNSTEFGFTDLYSLKRILFILMICFISPPAFFIFGFRYSHGDHQVYVISDYKLMKLIMNSKHRYGLIKGFVWDVDMTWFRNMCLLLGLLELACAFAGIAIGLGVGLTRN